MAGHARFTALLDACVLYPAPVADLLISLHVAGLFAARWTNAIDDEWMRNVIEARPDLAGKLERRRDAMRSAVSDWEVEEAAWNQVAAGLKLPDPNDVHVLAAAVAGHADCIVTANLKDFPAEVLAPLGLEAIHPDDFVLYQIDLEPYRAVAAVKGMRARLRKPAMGVEEFLSTLERNQLVATASRLREAAELI
jgi:predicted nucleic acid-binding protein